MSTRTLSILLAVLFVLTVVARLPARWALAAHPAAIDCDLPSGSIWRGACAQLRAGTVMLEGVSWRLHSWPLLRGHLDVDLVSADARAPGTAYVSLRSRGRVVVHDLHADLPVDSGFLPVFPNGWSGQLQLAFSVADFRAGHLSSLHGTATARGLARSSPAMPIGSYELRFDTVPGAAGADAEPIVGELRDLGGPLAVSGKLTIRDGSDYELSGLVAVRPEASPELAKSVEFLGPSDAQGRRPFSIAGTF